MKARTFIILLLVLMALGWIEMLTFGQSTPQTAVKVNRKMTLIWDLPDPFEQVVEWDVYVESDELPPLPLNPDVLFTVQTNRVELASLMTLIPNGVYRLNVVAVSLDNIEGDPSDPFWVFWYGRPSKVSGLRVEFTNAGEN